MLLLVGSNLSSYAQEEFNPENPKEPQANYKVRTSVQPQEAGAWVSVWDENWDGCYTHGETIHLECPMENGWYTFSHWTLNGETYSEENNISYTMGAGSVNFVAHYTYSFTFDPVSPDDPASIIENRLYLVSEPLTACYFNQPSGQKWGFDEWIYLYASPRSEGYIFLGWFNDEGMRVSESNSFYYQMPNGHVRLIARFEYNPVDPFEPENNGTQEDVQNFLTGDANDDGVVDVADIVRVINLCLTEDDAPHADVNVDGVVDVSDVVTIVNICLKRKK